ncbi:potassium channel protein [Sinobaca sp. H24]|uniref:potassium channel family protein n=1 Tax=Sinobaca sp. H24 TaxID=2923376 RepID=UPI00207A8818|nr:potassium channel protein [Sinobaca sp. H24]
MDHIFFSQIFGRLIKVNSKFIFLSAGLLIVFSSYFIYYLEPETFESPFNGFWWVMTTVTTVGFGDYSPVTVGGKLYAIFLYIIGIGLISIVISKIVDYFYIYNRKKEGGRLDFKGKGHIVIIDWSRNAGLAIQEILHTDKHVDIVIVDQLEQAPIHHDRVHYVKGNPIHKETLDQANIKEAKAVFVFPNELTRNGEFIHDPSYIDGKTLLIATNIERHYDSIYIIVEVKERENIHNFTHVRIDEFILSSEMVAQLAVRSAFSPGTSRLVSQLLSKNYGDDLYEISKRPEWNTYREAFKELLHEGATLVSDGQDFHINQKLDEKIGEEARLFVICSEKTYDQINKRKKQKNR